MHMGRHHPIEAKDESIRGGHADTQIGFQINIPCMSCSLSPFTVTPFYHDHPLRTRANRILRYSVAVFQKHAPPLFQAPETVICDTGLSPNFPRFDQTRG